MNVLNLPLRTIRYLVCDFSTSLVMDTGHKWKKVQLSVYGSINGNYSLLMDFIVYSLMRAKRNVKRSPQDEGR